MKTVFLLCVLAAGCAKPPEARVVNELPVETGILYSFDVDTLRWKKDGKGGAERFVSFIETHMVTAGPLREGTQQPDMMIRRVQLPSPGYLLRVRIKPRADDFCHVSIDLVSATDETQLDRAPFAAMQALEAVYQGVSSFLPPRLGPLDNVRFAKLCAQAAKLGAEGKDPPLTQVEYKRVPRPVQLVPQDEYWVPPSTTSTVAPNQNQ